MEGIRASLEICTHGHEVNFTIPTTPYNLGKTNTLRKQFREIYIIHTPDMDQSYHSQIP